VPPQPAELPGSARRGPVRVGGSSAARRAMTAPARRAPRPARSAPDSPAERRPRARRPRGTRTAYATNSSFTSFGASRRWTRRPLRANNSRNSGAGRNPAPLGYSLRSERDFAMKMDKQALAKHHFWILLGAFALFALILLIVI